MRCTPRSATTTREPFTPRAYCCKVRLSRIPPPFQSPKRNSSRYQMPKCWPDSRTSQAFRPSLTTYSARSVPSPGRRGGGNVVADLAAEARHDGAIGDLDEVAE